MKPVIHEDVAESLRTQIKYPRLVEIEEYPSKEEFEARKFFVRATADDIPPSEEEIQDAIKRKVKDNTYRVRVATGLKILHRLIQELPEVEHMLVHDYLEEAMQDEMLNELKNNSWRFWL